MEKKTVKIQFSGFWHGCDPMRDTKFAKVLKKHYNVVLSDRPDYLICAPYEPLSVRAHFGIGRELYARPQSRGLCDFTLSDFAV